MAKKFCKECTKKAQIYQENEVTQDVHCFQLKIFVFSRIFWSRRAL